MTGRWRTNPTNLLPLLCALYLILYLDRVNIATAAPLIQGEMHLSNAALGVVLSAFAYTYALCQLIGGLAGERFGPRTTLSASVVLVCIATAATGFAGGMAGLIAARIALGLGEGAALPTATQAMAKRLPQARWGFAQGITHSFARLGNFATPPIVVALIAVSSWRTAFFVLSTIGLLWIIAWQLFFHDAPIDLLPPVRGKVARSAGRGGGTAMSRVLTKLGRQPYRRGPSKEGA